MSGYGLDTGTKPFYRSALSIVGFWHKGMSCNQALGSCQGMAVFGRHLYVSVHKLSLIPLLLVLLVGQWSRSALTYRSPSVLAFPSSDWRGPAFATVPVCKPLCP